MRILLYYFTHTKERCCNFTLAKKKTYEEVACDIYDLVGDEYTLVGEYVNHRTKVRMRHNTCGYEYEVFLNNFKFKGSRCPKCQGLLKGTTESFKQKVYDLVGDEYTVLGEYVNAKTKIKMRHNACGHEYYVIPPSFKSNGSRCPKCHGNIKGNTKQFKQEVYDLVGNEYTVLGRYRSTHNRIRMRHNACGHEYYVTPSSFKSNSRRCPKCQGLLKGNTKSFKQEIYDLVGDEYTVLGRYRSAKNRIRMKHNICGHEYYVAPSNFKAGNRCPKCYGTPKKTHREFVREVYDLVGKEYTVLGKYVNTNTKILMRHNKCGHEYEIEPYSFKAGTRCPKCYGTPKKTRKEFLKEVYNLVGDEYTVLGSYRGTNTRIRMKHNICGHDYLVKPSNFKSGSRCPKCNESKGEKLISDILNKLDINYIREKTFPNCKYKRKLRFDFYIKSLNLCIEFDGIQHFEQTNFHSSNIRDRNKLEDIQIRDQIKDNYCKDHNIMLKRFRYDEIDNLEDKITKLIEVRKQEFSII